MSEMLKIVQENKRKFDAYSYFPIEAFFPQEIH